MEQLVIGFFLVVMGAASLKAVRRCRDLKEKLNTLQQLVEHERRQVRRQNYLVNEIAHDIKNPLTAILCSAEALDLMIGNNIEPAHRRSLQFIHQYSDQVLRLLSDFLDINRIQNGHVRSRKERVYPTQASEAVLGLLSAMAEREQVQLSVVVLSAVPPVLVDPVHLKQVLFNLVHNAIKFSGAGSEISVILSYTGDSSGVAIEVADNGIGIEASRIPSLFDPYQHCDSPIGEKRQHGLGLGLSLCRSLVELEGGVLSVRSEQGKGASFSFEVPIDPAAVHDLSWQYERVSEDYALLVDEEPLPVLDGQRILVVDPDAGACAALSSLIGAWGAMVDSVREAEDAVRAIAEHEYDSILVDTFSSGEHLSRLLPAVQASTHARVPRIIRAGDFQEKASASGEVSLQKPINSRELLGALLSETLH